MFIPAHFREEDLDQLYGFIESNSFGILTSADREGPSATHLPFLLSRQTGSFGQLSGHLARANSHWKTLDAAQVLVIFQGPHAYISPSWYEAEKNVVPTWNYVAVHVTGRLQLRHEPGDILDHLRKSVEFFESSQPDPWSIDSQDTEYLEKLAQAVVAFEIDIEQIEGKWKLSQNHSEERRKRIVNELAKQPESSQPTIADLMAENLGEGPNDRSP